MVQSGQLMGNMTISYAWQKAKLEITLLVKLSCVLGPIMTRYDFP